MAETPSGVFMNYTFMNYTIELTDDEVATLGWAVNHGYFPTTTYNAMHLADGEPEETFRDEPRKWNIPEHAAWAILMQREEDTHSLFASIGASLLEKLIALESSIV